ncbi:MAG: AMIN domain-containing protein, partial [Candidatus Aminicenantes bacterium]|nr:AMIN domain-containing protein [Candidatus Aminicenantes bacterium]
MKRKTWQLAFLGLFIFCAVHFLYSSSVASIDKIAVQPGKLRTKVVLETGTALPAVKAFYSKESPRTLVLEIESMGLAGVPPVQSADPELLENIRVEKTAEATLRLLLQLREQVPYRVYNDRAGTIVELNKVLRGETGYVVETEVDQELAKRTPETVFMHKLSLEENEDALRFRARLSSSAIPQVFTLENPLRLVVDVFNTIYEEPATVQTVEKSGLKRARVAQFQLGNPRSITRIVFDLDKPRQYDLDVDNDEIVIAFFKDRTSRPVVASAPAVEKPLPAASEAVTPPAQPASPPPREVKPAAVSNGPKIAQNEKQAREVDAGQEVAQEEKFKPKTIAEAEVKYTGEIITLRFKDADLRDVILFLGDFAKLNVVFDPEVRGVVTCNLEDVPWDQALDILLR